MRLDRFLTLHFFYPFISKISFHNQDSFVPILMYHSISSECEKMGKPYYDIHTSPEVFRQHMSYLHRNQYKTINLSEALCYLTSNFPTPGKTVVLTFDDGYEDFYHTAMPILKEFGFSAIVYLPTAYIDNESLNLRGKSHLNWIQVRELIKEGVFFGSHTVNHPQLRDLRPEGIVYELRHSKDAIEDNTGMKVESFSYPFAFPETDTRFSRRLRSDLQKCGYRNGVCTRVGTVKKGDDAFFLKRIPVNLHDDIPFLRAKLEGGYDWLNIFQYIFKFLKQRIKKLHA